MLLKIYNEICSRLKRNAKPIDLLPEYQQHATLENLEGIYSRFIQSTSRKLIWAFEARKIPPKDLLESFLTSWDEHITCKPALEGSGGDEIILKMATENFNVSPCYFARIIVKAFADQTFTTNNPLPKVSCDLDDLDCPVAVQPTSAKTRLPSHTNLYRNPSLIPHKGLSLNVSYCHQHDLHFSPSMDEFRNNIGKEYEDRLSTYLNALGIAYLDEPGMRRMGYSRTPDAVLLEPIAIDGVVVKWIESKAWFGDPPSHATYLRDQYWPYYNRFGPGLVIYWFGFVDEATSSHQAKGVAVMDHFPDATRITRIESSFLNPDQ